MFFYWYYESFTLNARLTEKLHESWENVHAPAMLSCIVVNLEGASGKCSKTLHDVKFRRPVHKNSTWTERTVREELLFIVPIWVKNQILTFSTETVVCNIYINATLTGDLYKLLLLLSRHPCLDLFFNNVSFSVNSRQIASTAPLFYIVVKWISLEFMKINCSLLNPFLKHAFTLKLLCDAVFSSFLIIFSVFF